MPALPGHRCGTSDPWICRCEPEAEITEIDYERSGLTLSFEEARAKGRRWAERYRERGCAA